MRTLFAVALSFSLGFCLGPISVFGIYARHVLLGREDWPELTADLLLATAVSSLPAAVNGAIGAAVANWRGNFGRWPVTLLPVAIHIVVGVGALVVEPQSFYGFQLYALLFTSVIWSAGRIGQQIGGLIHPRN
jgi:hypothetical protein